MALDDEFQSADIATPHDAAAFGEFRDRVNDAIASLPPNLRQVVQLYYLKGCTQLEAAAFLALPITTVNNRLSEARRTLRERISAMTQQIPLSSSASDPQENVGVIVEVDAPLFIVRFDQAATPDIFDALATPDRAGRLATMKVVQRLDRGIVRCLASGDLRQVEAASNVLNTRSVGLGLTPYSGVASLADDQLSASISKLAGPRSVSPPFRNRYQTDRSVLPTRRRRHVRTLWHPGCRSNRAGGGANSSTIEFRRQVKPLLPRSPQRA